MYPAHGAEACGDQGVQCMEQLIVCAHGGGGFPVGWDGLDARGYAGQLGGAAAPERVSVLPPKARQRGFLPPQELAVEADSGLA